MENKTSEKSLIFVSHSSKDKQLAEILRQQLFQVLENIISEDVFVSSSPEGIDAGALWFKNVISTLKKATALIVLVTPNSLQSNWVWFEIGYFWSKKHKQIYPLYVPDVDKIPHPLNEHQAKSLVDPDEMLAFYNILCNQFKGNPKKANPNAFTEYSASITNSKLSESDVKALLRDYFTSAYKSETFVLYAKLEHELSLPRHSCQQFIKDIVTEYSWIITDETENGIRINTYGRWWNVPPIIT